MAIIKSTERVQKGGPSIFHGTLEYEHINAEKKARFMRTQMGASLPWMGWIKRDLTHVMAGGFFVVRKSLAGRSPLVAQISINMTIKRDILLWIANR